MTDYNFDPIRPYLQEEISPALERIVSDPQFDQLMHFLFPQEMHKSLKENIRNAKTTHEFQKNFMLKVIRSIIGKTAEGLSVSGIENLDPGKGYVMLANHRDIILDSSILALHLVTHGFETCKITWGDNLMISPFVVDIGKANRMITVFRDGSPKEMLKNSQLLSAYIRESTSQKKQSVWIAQRKGRSKDGTDTTDVGVLKMLSLTGEKNVLDSLKELNIIPVTISYEWEPCDGMKVRELSMSEDAEYVKEENEDLRSIIGGVVSQKGRIHLHVGEPLNNLTDNIIGSRRPNELLQQLALLVDQQMHDNYKLWPSNYLAYDLLENSSRFADKYNSETEEKFAKRLDTAIKSTPGDPEKTKALFLKLYANPVKNKKNISAGYSD